MSTKRSLCLGLLIAAMIVSACSPQATPEPTATPKPTAKPASPTATSAPAATATSAPEATAEVIVPSTSGGEVPMGITEEGAPYRGNPDASVTLVEYSDYQ